MARNIRSRAGPGRLAAEVSTFINRRREIAEVRRLLSTARLVTLTGAGGTGKTRLAVRVARELRRAFADGVWQVDLAGIGDGSLLEYAVADALGLRGAPDVPTSRLLIDYLSDRSVLLVLDNCEHLVDDCARLVNALLRAASGVRALCTSRQPLGVIGETVFTVTPLSVPEPGVALATGAAVTYAALALFAERAGAAVPGFTLHAGNLKTVVEICERLDGLPLAIELAAAQLRTRSIEQLAAGLADRFRLLATRHAIPGHHRRLQETFDWSFTTCTVPERKLWARVAVFRGSFDLHAVTTVCASDDLPVEAVVDSLAGLVDKSIAIREEVAGQNRYRLLDTVREYGLGQLGDTDGMPALLRRRHRDWYLHLAERFEAEWFGPDQQRWLTRLRLEQDNVRAAIGWCLTTPGESRAGLRLVADLQYYWLVGGALREGADWLDRALAANSAATPERARALHTYCRILVSSQGDAAQAPERAQEFLALSRRLDEPSLVARAFHVLCLTAQLDNDMARAQQMAEEAVVRFAALGEMDATVVSAQIALARTVLSQGDRARAARICAECYAVCAAHGEQWGRSQALGESALVALDGGDVAQATGYANERLRIKSALGDTLGIATTLEILAGIAVAAEAYERAALLLGAADRVRQQLGQRTFASPWLRSWREEYVAAAVGALGEAGFDDALRRGTELSHDDALAYALGAAGDRTRRTRSAKPAAEAGPAAPLTRRERQVAELIAEGLSNKQIASRLVISQRTAESHVENILTKLGFTSRTQVASWVTKHPPS